MQRIRKLQDFIKNSRVREFYFILAEFAKWPQEEENQEKGSPVTH